MKGKPNLLFLRGICVCQEGFLEALFGGLDVWPVRYRPPFTLALLLPLLCPPILTPQGEGFQRRKNQKLRDGGKKKCFSGSDVWESNERPSSNPVARQPKWYAEGISLKLESKQSLWISKPTTGLTTHPNSLRAGVQFLQGGQAGALLS